MGWDLNPFLAFTGNMTFFRTEVVNEDEALRCINKENIDLTKIF